MDINTGFDKGLDFEKIKKKLLKKLQSVYYEYDKGIEVSRNITRMIYLTISLIQLRNASRIVEACEAFCKFIENGNINENVIVKIAKSEGKQYNNKTKEMTDKKARFRQLMFPDWISKDIFKVIRKSDEVDNFINSNRQCKRVLDYLLMNCDTNTHSLRYAGINYLLSVKKLEMNVVSKFVGHTNVNQLVTYTQNKKVNEIFKMNI